MIRPTASVVRLLAAAALALGLALAAQTPGEAHKAITSKYLFNEDMFPLFRDRCGRCHVDGGVAPMSLLTHEDASPWAESLRLEFLSEEPAPPWHQMTLTPRELDMMLVWANGGTPRGDASKPPPPVKLVNEWAQGAPDVPLRLPAPFTLEATANEASHEVVLPLTAAAGRTIGAVDLLPGNPAIVRSAVLKLKTADGDTRDLGTWMPGRTTAVVLAAPVKIAAGASLTAPIEYRRTWKYEGQMLTDHSAVGLYDAGARRATPSARPAPGAARP
ncbi:MAG: hypothetical protein JNL48_00745 [Acidobacteria bacterium]|nr:hypothetical protein [Acidobacteriota bacterium]